MNAISYVNGCYLPQGIAAVSIDDRGYQFADGVYEYIAFYNRQLLDADLHFARLFRSLEALKIEFTMSKAAMLIIIAELIERNRRCDGGFYLQITRGVAKRDHVFPTTSSGADKTLKPSLIMTICAPKYPKEYEVKNGVRVITYPDQRWHRKDIKSTALLANVLAKQEASCHQARESLLVMQDGNISEGAVSNAYIVNAQGAVVTHPADHNILSGVTRAVVLKLAQANNIKVIERPFSVNDLATANEAFITSTSANVLPVVRVNENNIGNGKPGIVTKKLMALYHAHIKAQTGKEFFW